jgi:hypothetical protein
MDTVDLQTLYADGWDIGNHTKDHTGLPTLTEEEQEVELSACAAYLDALGLTRGSHHVAYPGYTGSTGGYDDNTLTAMAATGMLTGRAGIYTPLDPSNILNLYILHGYSMLANLPVTNIINYVKKEVGLGHVVIMYAHDVGNAGSIGIEDFTELCNQLHANGITTYTISEIYDLITDRPNNKGFESANHDWIDNGNHSAVRSTDYKKSGNTSLKITATAAGDATTNYESLPSSAFTTIVSGNKYTKEFQAYGNSVGVTLAMKIGDQVVTGKVVYSAVAGTFAKVVFNFQATANTVSQPIQLYLSGAGDCYIDDVSLTQSFDFMIVQKIKATASATSYTSLAYGNAGSYTNGGGYGLLCRPDRTQRDIYFQFGDNSTSKTAIGATGGTDGNSHTIVVTGSRTGYAYIYSDGANSGSISIFSIGRITPTWNPLQIGTQAGLSLYSGLIGETQIVRFPVLPSNITSIVTQISMPNAKPLSAYENGTIVGWWDWKNQGLDKSGNGNNLTNVGGAPIVSTGISNSSLLIPSVFALFQNYPNPFNPSTIISFSLPSKSFVSLRVFDLIGREVATIISEEMSAGNHTKQWYANGLTSGVYFYRIQAGTYTGTKKLVLLK